MSSHILDLTLSCKSVFGAQEVVYIVHMFSHLGEDAAMFGPLNLMASFHIERLLGMAKRANKTRVSTEYQVRFALMC